MLWYTHALLAVLISKVTGLNPYLLVIGALLPDIDSPHSLLGGVFKKASKWVEHKYGHRSITHSLIFIGALMIVPAIGVGVLSHIVLDLLCNSGVKIMYPRKTRYVLLGAPLITGKHDLLMSIMMLGVIIF